MASATVNVDTATPVPTTVSFSKTSYTAVAVSTDITTGLKGLMTLNDQYGIALDPNTGFWSTSDSTVVAVDNSAHTVTTTAKAGTATVTYTASNGKQISITVVNP